jgi:hypothetical protein
MVPIKDLKGV